MTSLRCLWVTRLVPYPPFVGGDATYSAQLIASLATAGAEITVLCHDNGGPPPPRQSGVDWIVIAFRDRGRVRSLLGRAPAIVHRFSTPQIRNTLETLLRNRAWDAVLIDNVALAGALAFGRDTWPVDEDALLVYVSHNHEESLRKQLAASAPRRSPKRLALRWDAAKTAPIERRLVGASDLVTVNTAHDGDLFRQHALGQRYLVLTPGYDGPVVERRLIDAQTPRRVALLGSHAWVAKQLNLSRFLDVAARPLAGAGIGVDVIGWIPDDFARRLRVRFPAITVTGAVDRVEPSLDRARVGIVGDEIGGGFKHKVLYYVFNRVPVASLAGSVAGTPLIPSESILEFLDLPRLVGGVIEAIDDFATLNAVQEAAFRACEGRFAWADRGRTLAEVLTELGTDTAGGES